MRLAEVGSAGCVLGFFWTGISGALTLCSSLVQEIWWWLIFDVCQWCFSHLKVFPSTSPCTTLFWIATFEGQWLKRVQTSEPAVPQHLTLLPAAFYLEQDGRTYLELVLMLYYEMLKVEIIASWGICSGLLLGGSFMLWWKRVRTRKRAWTKGRRVSGILGLWLCWYETC